MAGGTMSRVRTTLLGAASLLLLTESVMPAADEATAPPPIADQLLAHTTELELTPEQVGALGLISERRTQTLAVLAQRLRANEAGSSTSTAQDSVTLMQDIGRLRVMSDAEALRQLTVAQRQRWVRLHESTTRPDASPATH